MTSSSCPDCGKGLSPGRRYPFSALLVWLTDETDGAIARRLHTGGTTLKDYRCHGLLRNAADRMAARVGEHPYSVWPEMAGHDIEDFEVPCVECGERFVPSRVNHTFCSRRCNNRRRQRERYRSDPGHRAKTLARNAVYNEAARDALRRKQRVRDRARRDADPDWLHRRYLAERERRCEWQRQYRLRKKAEREAN